MTDIKPDVVVTDLPDASPSDPLEALSWLGESVEEVAEGLRARGIKGKRESPWSCPLHNYLEEFGWDYSITSFMMRNRRLETIKWEFFHSRGVAEFIQAFDKGKFPDLIDNNG